MADETPPSIKRVNLRKSHPALYRTLMTVSMMKVALAVNFWTSHPTFNPYDIDKNLIGGIFLVLGVSQILFLNVFRDLRRVRLVLAVAIGFTFFWGGSNTQQAFAHKASFQLPILYIALSLVQVPLLIEPPVNPATEKT